MVIVLLQVLTVFFLQITACLLRPLVYYNESVILGYLEMLYHQSFVKKLFNEFATATDLKKLKDKSGAGIIVGRSRDYTVVNDVYRVSQ